MSGHIFVCLQINLFAYAKFYLVLCKCTLSVSEHHHSNWHAGIGCGAHTGAAKSKARVTAREPSSCGQVFPLTPSEKKITKKNKWEVVLTEIFLRSGWYQKLIKANRDLPRRQIPYTQALEISASVSSFSIQTVIGENKQTCTASSRNKAQHNLGKANVLTAMICQAWSVFASFFL